MVNLCPFLVRFPRGEIKLLCCHVLYHDIINVSNKMDSIKKFARKHGGNMKLAETSHFSKIKIHQAPNGAVDQGKRKEFLMSNINTNPKVDHQIFKRTAATTKKINVKPRPIRGGIRL